jgi:hypothetical protein
MLAPAHADNITAAATAAIQTFFKLIPFMLVMLSFGSRQPVEPDEV